MRKLFWDLETTVKNKGDQVIGGFPASPFHPANYIVLHQWQYVDCSGLFHKEFPVLLYYQIENSLMSISYEQVLKQTDLVVGHNVKFDLLYAMRFHPVWREWLKTGKIYDTMLAEYLISGHTKTSRQKGVLSLNALSKKYHGTLKDDRIKEYWDTGWETEDIPRDQLEEYGKYDVINTRIIYEAQQKTIDKLGIRPLIEANMEALLCTTEMEYNGMYFDTEFATEQLQVLEEELQAVKEAIIAEVHEFFPEDFPLNLNSSDHLSAVLFGGPWKYTRKEPQIGPDGTLLRYGPKAQKAGQVKYKNIEIKGYTKGLGLIPKKEWESAKKGVYFTNEDVLKSLQNTAKDVIIQILKLRELEKDIGTYFKGYSALVWPDGCIHGKLNMTQTNTGRLSSSSPNTQNLTRK